MPILFRSTATCTCHILSFNSDLFTHGSVFSGLLLQYRNINLVFAGMKKICPFCVALNPGLIHESTAAVQATSRRKLERQEEGKHTSSLGQCIPPPWKQRSGLLIQSVLDNKLSRAFEHSPKTLFFLQHNGNMAILLPGNANT